MRAVIIYDADGKIFSVNYGELNEPKGLRSMVVDVPDNVQSIDKIEGDKPVYTYIPRNTMDSYDQEIAKLHKELIDTKRALTGVNLVLCENLTDEQALRIPNIYPEWSGKGVLYRVGERVSYNGKLWRVITEHTSQNNWTPNYSPSLFAKVINEGAQNEPVVWEQPINGSNPYLEGDTVIHNGKVWASLIDGNIWEPGVSEPDPLWAEVRNYE